MISTSWRQVTETVADNPKQFLWDLSLMLDTVVTVDRLVDADWLTEAEAYAILDSARKDYRDKWGFPLWDEL